jgi:putative ABC transport system substrate-binding protein
MLETRDASDFPGAFEVATRDRADALLVVEDAYFTSQRTMLVELARRARLPAIYANRQIVDEGGLMSYGPNFADQFRRTAIYVDKIFRGARPADLPIELPTMFDFVVNLKTAQSLGLTIPTAVLQQATEMLQ